MFGTEEFSRLSQISVMMLLYYSNIGILRPDWTDPATGKRYYLAEQIEIAEKIKMLRSFGFSISEISVIHQEWNDSNIMQEIRRKKSEIETEIMLRRAKIKAMDQYMEKMEAGALSDIEPARLKTLPELQIYSVSLTEHLCRSESLLWNRLKHCMEKQELSEKGIYLMIHYGCEYRDQANDGELGLVLKEEIRSKTEAVCRTVDETEAVCCRVMGGEEKLRKAYYSIANWMADHENYKMCDSIRKIYKKKSEHTKGAEQKIIELQIPVTKIC